MSMNNYLAVDHGLTLNDDGVWVSDAVRNVSYPSNGHNECLVLEENSFWFRHRNLCLVDAFERFQPEGLVLDVGGGNGWVSQALLECGLNVVLVEPVLKGALNARRIRHLPQVVCATLEDAKFKTGVAGVVGLFDVIEHVKDVDAFLKEVDRVLAPGGILVVTVPALMCLWSLNDEVAGHFRRYSQDALRQVLPSSYKTLMLSYFFSPLVVPLFIARSLPYRLGLPRQVNMKNAICEHGMRDRGVISRVLATLLQLERRVLRKSYSLPFGTSLLLVAQKPLRK
jgi:SAM-dependent methyltransferase